MAVSNRKKNTIVSKGKLIKIIDSSGKLTAVAWKENGLYFMKSVFKFAKSSVKANKKIYNMSQKEKWHFMLGHVNFNYLNSLYKKQLSNAFT